MKVIEFNGPYYGPIDSEKVLTNAVKADLDEVVVIGHKGGNVYVASSDGEIGDVMMFLEVAKDYLLKCVKEALDNTKQTQ